MAQSDEKAKNAVNTFTTKIIYNTVKSYELNLLGQFCGERLLRGRFRI